MTPRVTFPPSVHLKNMQFGRESQDPSIFVRDRYWDQILQQMGALRQAWLDTGILEKLQTLQSLDP